MSIRLGVEAVDVGLDCGRAVAGLGNESSVKASVESATWLEPLEEDESVAMLVVVAVVAVVVWVAASDDSESDNDVDDDVGEEEDDRAVG